MVKFVIGRNFRSVGCLCQFISGAPTGGAELSEMADTISAEGATPDASPQVQRLPERFSVGRRLRRLSGGGGLECRWQGALGVGSLHQAAGQDL
ncbi:hypothetical protein AERO8C_150154 [Aeromonas veronii]|uniref:Uncharacterized protein n=1 Tax=Aeromonas veronii TaxID=654 RepID=A0A653KVK5_AERVE|nr:hypothetical protein AERO8C_150154 [Aeromonas veronii]